MTRNLKIFNDSALTLCFVGVLVTGVMLHLKKHGIVIEPRPVLKAVHYWIGFGMTLFAAIHVGNYFKLLKPLKAKYPFTTYNSVFLLVVLAALIITGIVKLCSPVKIPHLGMWHYWLGIIMSVSALIHLWRMSPWLLRKFRQ